MKTVKRMVLVSALAVGLAGAQTVTCNCDPTMQSCVLYISGYTGPAQVMDGAYAVTAWYLLEQILQWLAMLL